MDWLQRSSGTVSVFSYWKPVHLLVHSRIFAINRIEDVKIKGQIY